MIRGRKQIAFDLDTKELKKHYPMPAYQNAYFDIRQFMMMEGFRWQQGSVYVSVKPFTSLRTNGIINRLVDSYPWLNFCMRDCTVTNIGKDYSLNHLFNKKFPVG